MIGGGGGGIAVMWMGGVKVRGAIKMCLVKRNKERGGGRVTE